jgi:WD40 repeat protein
MSCLLVSRHIGSIAKMMIIVGAILVLSTPLSAQVVRLRATFVGSTESVWSLAFSPDGKTLASVSPDNTIRFWDVATCQNSATLNAGGRYSSCSVRFSPDGKTLASGNNGNQIKLWNVATGKSITIHDGNSQGVTLVVFSPDGKTLASGGSCLGEIQLWNVATCKNTATIKAIDRCRVAAMAFTPDGKSLVSVGPHDGIRLWDAAAGKENTVTLNAADEARIEKLIGDLGDAQFFEREKAAREIKAMGPLAIDTLKHATRHPDAEISDRAARLVDLLEGSTVAAQIGSAAAFSQDCKILAAATSDNGVKLWEVATCKELAALKGEMVGVMTVVFSPDSKTLAAGNEDGTIKLWDVSTRKELATFKGHAKYAYSLAFSPDSNTLASGGDDKMIMLWNVTR